MTTNDPGELTDQQRADQCTTRKQEARNKAASLGLPASRARAMRHPAYRAYKDLTLAASMWDRAAIYYASTDPATRHEADYTARTAQETQDRAEVLLAELNK